MEPTFKQKATDALVALGITIGKVEGEEQDSSLVFHISKAETEIINTNKEKLEADLNAIVEPSDMFGMNVVIVEAKESEEEEEKEEETTEEVVEERAANEYELKGFDGLDSQTVVFYELNEDGSKQDGTTVEALLQVAIARLTDLNSRFQSPFNEHALSALNEAVHQLNERTRERVARGVEGTLQA